MPAAVVRKIRSLFTRDNGPLIITPENIQVVFEKHVPRNPRKLHLRGCMTSVTSRELFNAINDILANYQDKATLRQIIMIDMPLYAIPQCISNCMNIRILNMSGNRIQDLPWTLVYLDMLRVLNLAENAIRILPPVICQLISLKELNLCNNNLRRLPKQLLLLTNLQILRVSGNFEMRSPTMVICDRGKDAIFEALRNRDDSKRKNLLRRWKPYYESSNQIPCVKPLVHLCIDNILDNGVNYMAADHCPPTLKKYLSEEYSTSNGLRDLHQCSVCRHYFSNHAYFLDHVC